MLPITGSHLLLTTGRDHGRMSCYRCKGLRAISSFWYAIKQPDGDACREGDAVAVYFGAKAILALKMSRDGKAQDSPSSQR